MPGRLKLTILLSLMLLRAGPHDTHAGPAPDGTLARPWAFRPLPRPAVPVITDARSALSPMDAFLLAALRTKGLSLSPEADRATLIRRASLDLTGLPPSPEEVVAFVNDARPDAYARVLDRLLASPHFGERWGRHWLDAAGYADVMGGDNDAATVKLAEGKWRYRDYVIRAFNADKPYDRFVTEQLAGDELADWRDATSFTEETRELLAATGLLRCAPDDTDEDELNTPDVRHEILHQTVELVAGNLLALTLNCARCHDHKYDPVPQEDYYRFAALFAPGLNPEHWLQPARRVLADVPEPVREERDCRNWLIEQPLSEVKKQREAFLKPFEDRLFDARLEKVPATLRAEVKAAFKADEKKRDARQKYLVEKYRLDLQVKAKEVKEQLSADEKQELERLDREIESLDGQKEKWGTLQAVYDVGPPPTVQLLRRGQFDLPGEAVEPGFLTLLSMDGDACLPEEVRDDDAARETSGRRLALAQWLTAPDTPASALLARVFVNRAWQHLFGVGIVETSGNFGAAGTPPTHPELLDWLAGRFVDGDWQIKPLLREIMLSAAYRQSAAPVDSQNTRRALAVDPDNALLWRQRLRRLESESVRDSLLAVSGGLNRAFGGAPLPLETRSDGRIVVKRSDKDPPSHAARRSVYLLARRNYHVSFLSAFDQPSVAGNCTRRDVSAVVGQPLTMLNDDFVHAQAGAFAERVRRETGGASLNEQVRRAFLIALNREPTQSEVRASVQLIERQRKRLADGEQRAEYSSSAPHRKADDSSAGSNAAATEDGDKDGDKDEGKGKDENEDETLRRAFLEFCHALLNASEFLYTP